jgi:prepilin-type N-terminal cleavage/methylation domain-containing protein
MQRALHPERGFSLPELMLTVAVSATLMAMALPVMTDITQTAKLNEAVRLVERELQTARLKAVSTNSILRVRTNCPMVGYVRTVEVLGNGADVPLTRCDTALYRYPPDDELATRPNYDGPARPLPSEATVNEAVVEFGPDGTARRVVGGVAQPITEPVLITIERRTVTRTVTINGLGKVQIQ